MDTLASVDSEQAVTTCAITERSNFIQIAVGQIAKIFARVKLRYKSITAREEQENKIALLSKTIATTARLKLNRDDRNELICLRIGRVRTR